MSRRISAFFLLACSLSLSCGGGSPTSPSPFVPDPTNVWQDISNRSHTFVFNASQPGQESSNFTGEEDLNGLVPNPLTGRYMGRSIQFTVTRPVPGSHIQVNYSGSFTT